VGEALTNGVVDSTSAVDATFCRDAENRAVCVVDGYGVEIGTRAGRLVVTDGIGRTRRSRTFARATHGLARVVVFAGSGNITIDATEWLDGVGVGWVMVSPSTGEVLASSTKIAHDSAPLRRAQALCPGTVTGLEVAKVLTTVKLAGQDTVARKELQETSVADAIEALTSRLADSATLEEVRQLEAAAANLYFSAWTGVAATFVRKDVDRVPEHWKGFVGRRSAVNPGTARNATDPINALLNYSYRLLEAEGLLAVHAVGLDPGLGILHADVGGRDSLVLDVIDAVRPDVDRHVLQLLGSTTLRWRDFDEDERGVVRVLAPLTHRLAEAMPSYGVSLAPIVEGVARMMADASPYEVSTPSVLTRAKHRAVARTRAGTPSSGDTSAGAVVDGFIIPRRKSPRQRPMVAATPNSPMPTCKICGASIPREPSRPRSRARICAACLPAERARLATKAQGAGQTSSRRVTPDATERRRQANQAQRLAEQRWELEHEGDVRDREWYLREVLPSLADLSTTAIARATGMSTSSASKVRAGKRVPHPRWWEALRRLPSTPT